MTLTNTEIKNTKPQTKPFRIYDERGLYLEVAPSGGKWWRFKYFFAGKEKRFSLGIYPDVGLKEARDKRDDARKLVAAGVDPGENRKAMKKANEDKVANSFEVIAREWLDKFATRWSVEHCKKILRSLDRDIFPWIGTKPISGITAPELLMVLRRIEIRGALETAHRILANCGQIFRYAISTGRAEKDPSLDLKSALPPVKSTHLAAITNPEQVSHLLKAIDNYKGSTPIVSCALKLAPLVFVRPGELRRMEWSDINFESAEWHFTATKTKTPHIVPLATQSLKLLREIQPITGSGRFVFPSPRTGARPMSENAVLVALRSLGFAKDEMTGHGFRAMARTILDEVLGVRPDFIEHQLAHAVRDPNGRAYNRTAHLLERKAMMQQWADYLNTLKNNC